MNVSGAEFDFGSKIAEVAKLLLDEPNRHLSSLNELRYGDRGALSIDLENGVWTDFANEHPSINSGGCLQLIERVKGLDRGAAVKWMQEHGLGPEPEQRPAQKPADRKIDKTYDYTDENGDLLFQVVRFIPKDFRQRRPDRGERSGWNWSVKGIRQVPYRLPELIEDIAMGRDIFIPEGEKDVDNLRDLGISATCNAGGAGKWPESLVEFFVGANVVLLRDNDDSGRNHVITVGSNLEGVAKSIRVLDPPGVPAKGDISDWLDANPGGIFKFQEMVEREAKPWSKGPPESRFGAVTWSNLDVVRQRQDWLIEDILFQGDTCLIYGESQSGKSFLTVDAALAVARGSQFLGKRTCQGGVIYQAGEGGKGLIKRLKAYRQHHEIVGDLPFVLLTSKVDLYSRGPEVEMFQNEVLAWKASLPSLDLLVIDTFSTASPGANENASEDMSRVLSNIEAIQRVANVAVIIVHHKNAAGEKPRGHTSLYANADSALEVNRDKDTKERSFKIAKVKDGEDGKKIGFRLQPVTIGSYDDGKLMTSCVVSPAQDGSTRAGDRPDRMTSAQIMFIRVLRETLRVRGVEIPPCEDIPHGARGVLWSEFQRAYAAQADPDRTDEALKKQMARDGDRLLNRGLIARVKPHIWLTDKGNGFQP